MPRDGAGNYTRLRRWTTDRAGGVPFSAERTDEDADDFASAIDAIDGELSSLTDRVETLEAAPAQTTTALATVVVSAVSSPPTSPANGAKYLILPTATGTFATHDNRVATYVSASTSWTYSDAPATGSMVLAKDTHALYAWDGSAYLKEGPTRETGVAAFDVASSVAVTFATAFANATYQVTFEPMSNHTFWITAKQPSGFVLNCSATISSSVRWTATL